MTRRSSAKPVLNYSADLVWAAACAAYRINGGYNKTPVYNDDGAKIVAPANKELVKLYLADDSHQFITEADYEHGRHCREVLSQQVTLAALKNQANEWNLLTAKMAKLETVTSNYEVAVIASMPKGYEKSIERESIEARLARCETSSLGKEKERINLTVEVVKAGYSQKYNTHFITAITPDNHAVFFAYREHLKTGTNIQITGTIKRHTDRVTQLNRVKLLETTK